MLANRLSADPRNSVLLLEAGGKDDWMWIHIPVGYLYCIGNQRTDWCYKTEAESGLNGRVINYPRGRVIGGSSSINAMLYLRGQARDYDEWAQVTGDSGWAWRNVLPIFMKSEDHWRGADEKHGQGGELRVERIKLRWDILEAFADAAAETGIPRTEDFNRGDNEGVGRFDVTQRNGVRWSAAKAFLRPAMKRPNLTVISGALVKKLRLEGRRVLGVDLGRKEQAGEIVLSPRFPLRKLVVFSQTEGRRKLSRLSDVDVAGSKVEREDYFPDMVAAASGGRSAAMVALMSRGLKLIVSNKNPPTLRRC